ncbi:MAG: site-specific integrase, partial [Phycisphaerae bacterium]|nr:site-specific integrase [Phycisphaerae bacterium]
GVKRNYQQAIAEWLAAGRQLPADPDNITIKELLARFWIYAEQYYRTAPDGRVKELEQFRLAMRPMKELYADTRAIDFGPRALKALRQRMVVMGWSRPYINKQINRVRHMYKWAVSDELVPGSALHALQAVPGLRRGRSDASEPEAVKPVAMELVEAIKPFVARQVWAMIQLQLFTAARPGALCQMRPCDIDREGNIWVYTLKQHKTAWHGHSRKIWIGPRGQQVLAPFLLRDPGSYCFSPDEAEAERRRRLSEQRVTPLSCGNVPGSNVKDDPQRSAGERYTTCAYRRAIVRACDRAFPLPEPLVKREDETSAQWQKRLTKKQKAELKAWQKAHRWHPHQLRHNAATNLRKEFGLEAARIILGHRSAAITEVYAELDQQKAIDAMLKIG